MRRKLSKALAFVFTLSLLMSTMALASDAVSFDFYCTGTAGYSITAGAYKNDTTDADVSPSASKSVGASKGIRYMVKRGSGSTVSSLTTVSGSAERYNTNDFSLSYKSGYAKKSYNNKLYGKFLYSGNTTVNVVGTWYP